MSVTLKLSFDSIEAAQEFLKGKINVAAPSNPAPANPVQQAEVVTAAAPPAPATPAAEGVKSTSADNAAGAGKGKPGRKKAEPAAPAAPAATASAGELKETDVREKLMAVNNKFGENGLSKVADLLAPFGVQKIGDLKPEQYAEVVKAADAVLA